MRRQLRLILIVVISGLLLAACSSDLPTSPEGTEVTVATSLHELAMGSSVTRVVLEISGADFATFSQELTLTDGEASITLQVPFGASRLFRMSAYDANDVLVYFGETTADVIAGASTVVDILMAPQVSMMRISPMFEQAYVEDTLTLQVMIHDVDSLFGVFFRIEYNPDLIDIVDIARGNIFPADASIILTIGESNYVAVGYTLLGNQPFKGFSGSGVVVEIVYTAKAEGRSPLEFVHVQGETPLLTNWQGERLPQLESLYFENAEVEIIAP